MKYLLVLLVVGFALWSVTKRLRGGGGTPPGKADRAAQAQPIVACAHCGLHLPQADALAEGSRLYCSDEHRRLGPAASPPGP